RNGGTMKISTRRLLSCFAVTALVLPEVSGSPAPGTRDVNLVQTALNTVRVVPDGAAQYDYVMTARVRLLLFWAGKDDVGGGYIRGGRSKEEPKKEFFQVLFGSDPSKAPRAINRWGAGTEVAWHRGSDAPAGTDDVESSTFFGFMKGS